MKKDYEGSITNGFKKKCRLGPGPGEYFDILPYYTEKDNLIKGKTVTAKKEKIIYGLTPRLNYHLNKLLNLNIKFLIIKLNYTI